MAPILSLPGCALLRLAGQAGQRGATVRLSTRTDAAEAAVRWSAIRLTSSGRSFDILLVLPLRDLGLDPPPVLSPMRKAVEEALVEWDWRMQDGIETEREPRTYAAAVEKTLERGAKLIEKLQHLEVALGDWPERWVRLFSGPGGYSTFVPGIGSSGPRGPDDAEHHVPSAGRGLFLYWLSRATDVGPTAARYPGISATCTLHARASRLMELLLQGHEDVQLSADDLERFITWMDTNALFYGTFDGERVSGRLWFWNAIPARDCRFRAHCKGRAVRGSLLWDAVKRARRPSRKALSTTQPDRGGRSLEPS